MRTTQSLIRRLQPSVALAAGLTAAILSGAAQAAAPSSFTESKGYQNCVDAADRETQVIRIRSNYYIYEHDDSRRYYLNGQAFVGGQSQAVKIACDTTLSGNRVLSVSVDQGQYAAREGSPMEVARN